MKKIVVLFVCVLMFSYIYAEELPFDVNEGIEKTKNELAFYLNDGSLSDYFEKSTDVDDIQFSHFGKVQYLNTEMLVRENEIQLKGLPFDNYLFALTVKNEGKVLVGYQMNMVSSCLWILVVMLRGLFRRKVL